jgi:hypothetical protein
MKAVQTLPGTDLLSAQLNGCKGLHYTEEKHKIPKGKTKILFGEVTC